MPGTKESTTGSRKGFGSSRWGTYGISTSQKTHVRNVLTAMAMNVVGEHVVGRDRTSENAAVSLHAFRQDHSVKRLLCEVRHQYHAT